MIKLCDAHKDTVDAVCTLDTTDLTGKVSSGRLTLSSRAVADSVCFGRNSEPGSLAGSELAKGNGMWTLNSDISSVLEQSTAINIDTEAKTLGVRPSLIWRYIRRGAIGSSRRHSCDRQDGCREPTREWASWNSAMLTRGSIRTVLTRNVVA